MEEDKNKALQCISKRIREGIPERDIRSELIKSGWSEEASNTMLSGFRSGRDKKTSHNRWFTNLGIAAVIVIFGITGAYFFIFRNNDMVNQNDDVFSTLRIPIAVNTDANNNTNINSDSTAANLNISPAPSDLEVVAAINDYEFSYEKFAENFATMKHFYRMGEEAGAVVNSDDYITKTVLTRMIREHFLNESIRQYKILLLPKEIDDEFNSLAEETGSREDAIESISKLYDWDEATFKEKVIKPFLQEGKLRLFIATDQTINAAKYAFAQEALNQITAGEISFENAVPLYSDDLNIDVAGDLGYIGHNEALPEIENVAFSLDIGEVSGIISTLYGYHILKVTNKTDPNGPSPDRVRISHILFETTDYDEWFIQQLARRRIKIFIEGYEWRDDCATVVALDESCAEAAIPTSLHSSLE